MAAAAGFVLVEVSPTAAVALTLLPLIALAVVYLITSGQAVLYAAAIALPMSTLIAAPISGSLYYQDVIAAFALGALIFAKFLGRGRVPPIPRTPVLGWPYVLFAAAILSATLRGHYAYGTALFGQPLRLFFYAVIVAGLVGMTAQKMYRLLLALFYTGAVLAALVALFLLATGGSSEGKDAVPLSTGGARLLGIETSQYCAGALFLALLNLRLAPGLRARALHLSIAAVATFGVVAGFGRAVYTAVALVGVLLFITSRRLRRSVLSIVPVAVPFLVVLAIGVNQAAPKFVDSVADRMLSPPKTDANVQWRLEANRAVLAQVREQPLFGVGFGRGSEFFINVEDRITGITTPQRIEIDQDPHNGYIYLLAGGGLVALGSFVLLLGTFALDAVRRYRRNTDPIARLIILWVCATLFVFLLNAASGPSFGIPENILAIWALLVLPAVVRPASEDDSGGAEPQTEADHEIRN